MSDANPAEANLQDNAPAGLALSDGELEQARKDGAKEDVKDIAKDVHRALTDGVLPGDPPKNQYLGHDESQPYAGLLDLGVDAFKDKVSLDTDKDGSLPDEKVYGLLALERNGKNRTPYVKAMMERLDLDARELPGGGPSYTNDVTNVTAL